MLQQLWETSGALQNDADARVLGCQSSTQHVCPALTVDCFAMASPGTHVVSALQRRFDVSVLAWLSYWLLVHSPAEAQTRLLVRVAGSA